MDDKRRLARTLIKEILNEKLTQDQFNKQKFRFMAKHKGSKVPSNADLLAYATSSERQKLKKVLTMKPVRDESGVSVVSIVTKPHRCPHGKCTYCPGGVDSVFGTVPQSYTGEEPAMRRAERNNYDPYLQVFNRLEQYSAINKDPNKVELIILGGTFPFLNISYQNSFLTNSFKAFNDYSEMFYNTGKLAVSRFNKFFDLPADFQDKDRARGLAARISNLKGKSTLIAEQKRNESSNIRVVAMCLETRPDYAKKPQILQMLRLGTTRVELGVQTVYDSVLKKIGRGHGIKEAIDSTALMKDSFLKVGYHMMPGLPGSNKTKDQHMFSVLFKDQRFRPDALKIYPCMVMKGTRLYNDYKAKRFIPISTEDAAALIKKVKKGIPEYCRIMRVQRDIPTNQTVAGVNITNLRQYIQESGGFKCRCIRCRELRGRDVNREALVLKRINYRASGGQEVFLSWEDESIDAIVAFARLRIPNKPFIPSIMNRTAGIRELHVYGEATPVGQAGKSAQHKGLGMELVKEAERIAEEEYDMKKLAVISGVGAREYYKRKLGYKGDGFYMSKSL